MPENRLTRLSNLGINRVALVPKGDNPEAHLTLWKSAEPSHSHTAKRSFTADERKQAVKDGAAMSDGSYPIYNAADLAAAVSLVGSGKAPSAKVKAHIVGRATALKLTDKLPEGWMSKDDLTKEPRLTATRRTALEAARDAISNVLGRKEEEDVTETDKSYTLPENADDELRAYVEKLEGERDAAVAKAAETVETREEPETAEDLAKAMAKADPAIRAVLEKAQADAKGASEQAAEAMAKADELQKTARRAEAMQKAATLTHLGKAEDVADTIEKLRKADPDLAAEVEQRLDRAEALASEAFIEIGKDGGEDSTDAAHRLDALVKARAEADGTSGAVALTKVMDTPEGKELHKEINKEASAR